MEQIQGRNLYGTENGASSLLLNSPNGTSTTGIATGGNFSAGTVYLYSTPPNSPTAPKPFFRVDYPTPIYVGNQKKLSKIRTLLQEERTPTSTLNRTVVITGMGGIGKSELARNYANKFKEDYTYIAWIESETEKDLRKSFKRVGSAIAFDADRHELKEFTHELYNYLNTHTFRQPGGPLPKALFIFDNAMQMNSTCEEFGINEFLPNVMTHNCEFHVLITSQYTYWNQQMHTVVMKELDVEETLSYFYHHFQISDGDHSKVRPSLRKLAELLQGYPLAITLAAANIDYSPQGTSDMLRDEIDRYVNTFGKTFLTQKMNKFSPTKYTHTLATVWEAALNRLQGSVEGKCAMETLIQISLLQDPDVEFSTLTELFMVANPGMEPVVLEKGAKAAVVKNLQLLERHALVRVNWKNDKVSAHRLVKNLISTNHSEPNCVKKVLWATVQLQCYSSFHSSPIRLKIPWARLREIIPEDAEISLLLLSILLLPECGSDYHGCDLMLDSAMVKLGAKYGLSPLVEILQTFNLSCEVSVKLIQLLLCRLSFINFPDRKDGLLLLANALIEMSWTTNGDDAERLREASVRVKKIASVENVQFSEMLDLLLSDNACSKSDHCYRILEGLILLEVDRNAYNVKQLTELDASRIGNYLLQLLERWKDSQLGTFELHVITGLIPEVPKILCHIKSDARFTWAEIFLKAFWAIVPGKSPGVTLEKALLIRTHYWRLLAFCRDGQLFEHLIRQGLVETLVGQLKEINMDGNMDRYSEIVFRVLSVIHRTLDWGLASSVQFEDILRELMTFQCYTLLKWSRGKEYYEDIVQMIWLAWMSVIVKCEVRNADSFFDRHCPHLEPLNESKNLTLDTRTGNYMEIYKDVVLAVINGFRLQTADCCSFQAQLAMEVADFLFSLVTTEKIASS